MGAQQLRQKLKLVSWVVERFDVFMAHTWHHHHVSVYNLLGTFLGWLRGLMSSFSILIAIGLSSFVDRVSVGVG